MRRLILSSVVSLITLPFLIGCGKSDSSTLATVGSTKITAKDFNDRYKSYKLNYASAEDEYEKKKELLDSLVITQLLIDAAYEKNIDKLEELSRAVLSSRNRFLLDALYQDQIVEKSKPSEAEVKQFYKNLQYQVRAAHILVDNIDTANMLLEKIKAGENFEKLAFDYSEDPSAKRNRGDLGYFLWGAMVEEFQNAAFAMDPGEISPPVKTRFGYHIIKVIDKTPNDLLGEYDQIKDSLKIQLQGYLRQKVLTEFMDDMLDKYNVSVDTATCDYLMYKRSELYPPELIDNIPKNDFDLERLDRNEKELVLATWDGGQISLLEYFSLSRRYPENMRPNFDQYDSLSAFIFRLKTEEILAMEATKLGLEQKEYFKQNYKKFKELSMAEIMKSDSLPKPPPPTEEEIRAYYNDHKDDYKEPLKIRVHEILVSDEVKARELKESIKSIHEFKEQAMELTERPGKRSVAGDLLYIERQWYPEIFDLAQKTKPGTIAGPVLTRGKYSVIWVSDKLPERTKEFLSVKNEVVEQLTKESIAASFRDWANSQMEARHVKYNDEAIWELVDKSAYSNTSEQSSTQEGS